MSKRTKLEKFAENLGFPNVFENLSYHHPALYRAASLEINLRGQWNTAYFINEDPIVLELACGRGEYCLGLSAMFPQKNFIGIDIKGARIWKGAKQAFLEKNQRIAFIRSKIELIPHFFSKGEISEIWITFPDPFLKSSKSTRRLTSSYYLNIYKQLIKPGALIHLKTDDETLYRFTLDTIDSDSEFNLVYSNNDIYSSQLHYPELELKTYYEHKHLEAGKKIKYIRFEFVD